MFPYSSIQNALLRYAHHSDLNVVLPLEGVGFSEERPLEARSIYTAILIPPKIELSNILPEG